ncbi:MAG: helix-turn-helix transcriptional regulator [Bacteroidota bacterium]
MEEKPKIYLMTLFEVAAAYQTAMKAKGIRSNAELARQLKLSYSTITKLMAGETSVGQEVHDAVCEHLDIVVYIRYPRIGKKREVVSKKE